MFFSNCICVRLLACLNKHDDYNALVNLIRSDQT